MDVRLGVLTKIRIRYYIKIRSEGRVRIIIIIKLIIKIIN